MGALRGRNFRLLFVGQTASALGNTLVPVALAFGILDLTGSAADLGLVLGAEAAALVIFVLIGGVIADRIPRRRLMVSADLLRGGAQLTLGILFLAGHPPVIALIGLSVLIGIGAALFSPASTGLIPQIVAPEHLQQANGLQQSSSAAAGILGPAIAGVLVVTIGAGWAIVADAATFFVSAALLSRLLLESVPRPEPQRWIHDLRDGWQDFWGRKWFRTAIIGFTIFHFLNSSYAVLGPVASRQHYDGAVTWSIISTTAAVGALLGGLLAIRLKVRHPLRFALPVLMLSTLPLLALGFLLPMPVVAVAAALAGGSVICFDTVWQTAVQNHIPEEKLSRASSYDWFGSLVAYPIGLAVAGALAASVGSQPVLVSAGVLLMLLIAAMLLSPSVRNLTNNLARPEMSGSEGR